MNIFPNSDDFFKGDKSLKALIKTLESYIEIDFDMKSIGNSISALNSSNFLEEIRNTERDQGMLLHSDLSNILKDIQPLIDEYEKNKSQFQEMRDILWFIRDKLGVYSTLMLINSSLVLSMEMLFSGVVIMYSKAFSSSQRRTVLDANKIFKNNSKLLEFHETVIDLRNKHFAHSESTVNKHILTYVLDKEQNELNFNTESHTHGEFWPKFDYAQFYNLVKHVQKYLKREIESKAKKIKENLTPDQLQKLASQS